MFGTIWLWILVSGKAKDGARKIIYTITKTEGAFNMMINIKPCPFCGDALHLEVCHTSSFWIECENCGCNLHGEKTLEQAIKKWNNRKKDSKLEYKAEKEAALESELAAEATHSKW